MKRVVKSSAYPDKPVDTRDELAIQRYIHMIINDIREAVKNKNISHIDIENRFNDRSWNVTFRIKGTNERISHLDFDVPYSNLTLDWNNYSKDIRYIANMISRAA